MAAGGKQRAGQAGADVFDVRVISFAGSSARTLDGLQQLFGLDRSAAQRLLESVPAVVKRAAPANEAQSYQQALTGLGAQVELLRPQSSPGARQPAPPPGAPRAGPPPPPGAARAAPPPAPRAARAGEDRDAGLPKPIMRASTRDLEFELAPNELARDPIASGSFRPAAAQNQRGTRQDIVFDGSSDRLELDLDHGKPATREPTRSLGPRAEGGPSATRSKTGSVQRAASGSSERSDGQASTSRQDQPAEGHAGAPAAGARDGAQLAGMDRAGGGPMSRASVVQPTAAKSRDPRLRQIALLRMLAGLLIAAGGVWLDSSIVYGNANLASVLAHAVALYQLGLGARGLRS